MSRIIMIVGKKKDNKLYISLSERKEALRQIIKYIKKIKYPLNLSLKFVVVVLHEYSFEYFQV